MTAMNRAMDRVCAWLHEDRPADDAVTDSEFAAFLRCALEETRGSVPKCFAA